SLGRRLGGWGGRSRCLPRSRVAPGGLRRWLDRTGEGRDTLVPLLLRGGGVARHTVRTILWARGSCSRVASAFAYASRLKRCEMSPVVATRPACRAAIAAANDVISA